MISETWGSSGLVTLAVSRKADSRTGMYSSRPSPVSTRVNGFSLPIIYVFVPTVGRSSTYEPGRYDGRMYLAV